MTYDQVCEMINLEYKHNEENLRRTVETTGFPLSIVMEAIGMKDVLDFEMEEMDDEDTLDDTLWIDGVPHVDSSNGDPN